MVRDNILGNQEQNEMVEKRCMRLRGDKRQRQTLRLKLTRTSEVLRADEACIDKSKVLSEVFFSAQNTVFILAI